MDIDWGVSRFSRRVFRTLPLSFKSLLLLYIQLRLDLLRYIILILKVKFISLYLIY